jgi:hypothetical protein
MGESTGRNTTKNLKLVPAAHSRLKDHLRDGETMSGVIGRALDALEREDELPDAVTEVLRERADDE